MNYEFFVNCETEEQAKSIQEKIGGNIDSENCLWIDCQEEDFDNYCYFVENYFPNLKYGDGQNGHWANSKIKNKIKGG